MARRFDRDGVIRSQLLGAARRPAGTVAELVEIAGGRHDLLEQALASASVLGDWTDAAPWAVGRLREAVEVCAAD